MNAFDYYNDSDQHGNYQYITLEDLVNNYLMSRDADDYTASIPRFKILYQIRRAFREFYYDIVREIRAVSMELSPSLQITLPPDYVNYVRISSMDNNGVLYPLALDNTLDISQEYLQDHKFNLLFDNEGNVLLGDGLSTPTTTQTGDVSQLVGFGGSYHSFDFCTSFKPNLDTSKVYRNGKYKIDKTKGLIQFGSGISGKNIVLEYISDGLFTGAEGRPETDLRIHKFTEEAVYNFVYYELIKRRRNVPYNEKMRAKKEYWNSRRLAKMRINALKKEDLLQSFKASSVWIK